MSATSNAPSGTSAAAALDHAVIREAARWLVRLHSGEAGPEDHAALQRWRQERAEHELAWQRAERLSERFGALPPMLGVPVLTRATGLNRRALMKTLAALGVTVPVAWLAYRYGPVLAAGAGDYRSAVGEHREVILADGSQVQLNTATTLDVRYSDDSRLMRLRDGEIYVSTAPDTATRARPFLIDTAAGRMRALGTRFVVRQFDDSEGTTSLDVLEHRVEVTLRSGGARRIVDAGQSIRFSADGFKATPAGQRTAGAVVGPPAWTHGALEADNMRLDAFLAELSRYRPGIVRCDPAVAGLRVSGVFQLADTDHVLAVVGQTLPVRIVRRTGYWVTVTAAAS
ncbi:MULTISPECIES: FecR domain-containing protein [unclassified Achromobacter]|uniref:FecR domain-containing protein n=1 Tax=unclassified Achromobacter TaxID=2626865 RepID=UPI000B51B3F1|nr:MULTISPECIES: FecR domain-containing protein [unclassified Achromobacter]OWT80233.1 iron dicitrate transport regulator FecR [Achromobacter sp. HZ34]OWT82116.1 iron dicitrate transport regulator FecR [Achromobacter sp. HZ28]